LTHPEVSFLEGLSNSDLCKRAKEGVLQHGPEPASKMFRSGYGAQSAMQSIATFDNRFPSLEWFVISSFPVSQYRRDLEARLNGEGKRCLVLETDVNGAVFRGEGEFHIGNDLALGLWEPENAPIGNFLSSAGAGNFMSSQLRPPVVRLVRAAFVVAHGRGPSTYYQANTIYYQVKNTRTLACARVHINPL
jgi:hypothetical protein